MTEISTADLAARSGITRHPGETVSEYIDRLAARTDADDAEVEAVKRAANDSLFAPATSGAGRANGEVTRFLRRLDAVTPTPDTASENGERPRGDATTSDTSPVDAGRDDGPRVAARTTEEHNGGQPTPPAINKLSLLMNGGESGHGVASRLPHIVTSGPQTLSPVGDLARDLRALARYVFATSYDVVFVVTLTLVGVYAYYLGVDARTLQSWDEGVYANAALEMVQHGYWLVPHLQMYRGTIGLQPFLEKPPGMMWLEALSMLVFGPTTFAARFPSATFAILLGLFAYVAGRVVFDRPAGFVAGLAWLTTPFVFWGFNGGRQGGTDTGFVFFGSLFVFLVWRAVVDDRPHYLRYAGAAAAGALLIKGFAAGIFLVVLFPVILSSIRRLAVRDAVGGAAVSVFIVLPWAVYAHLQYPDRFLREIFFEQVLSRATEGERAAEAFGLFNLIYVEGLPVFFDPWVYLLTPAILVGGWLAWHDGDGRRLRSIAVLTWWAIAVFAFFSVTGNKTWYIMPMYIPCALLVGGVVSAATQGRRPAVAGVLVGAVAALVFSPRFALTPLAYAPRFNLLDRLEYGPQLPVGVHIAVVLGLLLAVALAAPRLRRFADEQLRDDDRRIGSHAIPVFVAFVLAISLLGAVPVVDSATTPGAEARASIPSDRTLYVVEGAASPTHDLLPFSYYVQRPLRPTTIEQLNDQSDIEYALLRADQRPELGRQHTVVVEFPAPEGGDYTLTVVHFT